MSEKRSGQTIQSHRELRGDRLAFEAARKIFERTESFPRSEKSSLSDQTRRSARSGCANPGETWGKRRYAAHFVRKRRDAEAAETEVWLEFALKHNYIPDEKHNDLQ